MYLEPDIKYSFKWVVNESHYDGFENNERTIPITAKLLSNVITNIKCGVMNSIISIDAKYKKDETIKINLEWIIITSRSPYPYGFMQKAYTQKIDVVDDIVKCKIVMNIIRHYNLSDKQFFDRLIVFFSRAESAKVLTHEVKHILDKIDTEFESDNTYTLLEEFCASQFDKYLSQDEEIDAHLVSVLTDLRRIRNSSPDIPFRKALSISEEYRKFVEYIAPNKFIKHKRQMVHYWSTIYNNLK